MRVFFFSSRRRHTRFDCDWSSDVCSSDLDETERGHLEYWAVPFYNESTIEEVNNRMADQQQLDLLRQGVKAWNAWRKQIGRAHGLNSSHSQISYAVFCLKKKNKKHIH